MSKATNSAKDKSTQFSTRLSPQAEMDAIRRTVDHLKSHRSEAQALFVKAGIYTASGKLTKAYGG